MTEEIKNISIPQSIDSLAGTGFHEMHYLIWVGREKFDTEKFRSELGPKSRAVDFFTSPVAPRDPKAGDYHINAGWNIEKDKISFRIEYLPGPKKHEEDEREPYAEQFVEWLGRFFRHETAQAHIHAQFEYPLDAKQSKFPLPLKTALEGDPEIEGISLKLPAKPKGVSRVRLIQGKTLWYVEVVADRRITFKGFSPYADVQAFLSVIGTLMEDKKS